MLWMLASGCTPLPAGPHQRRDAATGDALTDVAADADGDASADAERDVVFDASGDSTADLPAPDAVADVTAQDAPDDAARDGGAVRLTGTFVPSAVTGDRLTGGMTWQGPVNTPRLEGWLR